MENQSCAFVSAWASAHTYVLLSSAHSEGQGTVTPQYNKHTQLPDLVSKYLFPIKGTRAAFGEIAGSGTEAAGADEPGASFGARH